MQIFKEKVIFRLKGSEYGKFESIRKRENMNMADAGRLLFHLGLKAYQDAQKFSAENKNLENQERAGRQLSADKDQNLPFAQEVS